MIDPGASPHPPGADGNDNRGRLLFESGEHFDARLREQGRHEHQREADQARRIVRGDLLHEGDAELLDLRRAGAVEGLLTVDVGLDRLAGELPHLHQGAALDRFDEVVRADDGERRREDDRLALHAFELGDRAFTGVGLAELLAVEVGDLVRADDHGVGAALLDFAGLEERKAQGRLAGRLARQARFVDVRARRFKRHAETFEKFAAVARTRG